MQVTDFWWLSLGIAAAVVVVVAILLGLIIATAKSIDRHAQNIWTVGKQIAGNTVSIWMLESTNEHLEEIEKAAHSLEQSTSSMDETLRTLAGMGRRS